MRSGAVARSSSPSRRTPGTPDERRNLELRHGGSPLPELRRRRFVKYEINSSVCQILNPRHWQFPHGATPRCSCASSATPACACAISPRRWASRSARRSASSPTSSTRGTSPVNARGGEITTHSTARRTCDTPHNANTRLASTSTSCGWTIRAPASLGFAAPTTRRLARPRRPAG